MFYLELYIHSKKADLQFLTIELQIRFNLLRFLYI